jgi:hypothetical protein
MAWTTKRQTIKDEDRVYCLLGIFSIFMPLIYGEGKDSALKRLQREVNGLPKTGMRLHSAHLFILTLPL